MAQYTILHIAATTTGGVGQVMLDIAKPLDADTFTSVVAFGPGYLLDEKFYEAGLRVIALPTSRKKDPISTLRGCWQVYRLVRQEKFDLLQGHTSVGGAIARIVGWVTGIPAVYTIHGFAAHKGHGKIKKMIFRWIESALDRITPRYVAVSRAQIAEGEANGTFVRDKVSVIHNGIDADAFVPKRSRAEVFAQYDIPESAVVCSTVTRFEPQKAIDDLLHAMAQVKRVVDVDFRVLVAGDGPLRSEMEVLRVSLGLEKEVIFLGWEKDPASIIDAGDIFVLSSLWEGLPIVLLEAMALGKPMVTTDVGGCSEAVWHGENGFVSPPAHPQELAERLAELVKDEGLRERMGAKGAEIVREHFSKEGMQVQYEKLYREILGGGQQ